MRQCGVTPPLKLRPKEGLGVALPLTGTVEGRGLVVCEHGGVTPHWRIRGRARKRFRRCGYRGGPLEVLWGSRNVFNKGSSVVLKALPKPVPAPWAPDVSRFSHWSGGTVDGVTNPILRLVVDRDMTITAHFMPIE